MKLRGGGGTAGKTGKASGKAAAERKGRKEGKGSRQKGSDGTGTRKDPGQRGNASGRKEAIWEASGKSRWSGRRCVRVGAGPSPTG